METLDKKGALTEDKAIGEKLNEFSALVLTAKGCEGDTHRRTKLK